jgi:acylaminoacyl-peptidase
MTRLFAAILAATALAGATHAETRPFVAKDMILMERVSDPHVSPDGHWVAYDLRTTDLEANKGVHAIWLKDLTDPKAPPRRLAVSDKGANTARWSSDGHLYFLSSRSGSSQVWRTDATGETATQVTDLPLDVQAYRVSPDGKRIVVGLAVFPDCPDLKCTVDRQAERAKGKPSGQLYEKLFVRHWDEWEDGTKNHLFTQALGADGKAAGIALDITKGLDADVPTKPFGGEEDFAFTADSTSIIYSARIAGNTEPWSTNFDLYEVALDGHDLFDCSSLVSKGFTCAKHIPVFQKNLTPDNPAWDAAPVVSPDGRFLAYRAMKRPGFESDRFGVMVKDLKTGATREVDPNWDRSAQSTVWSADGKTLYVTAEEMGQTKLFAMEVATGAVKPLTGAGHVSGFDLGPKGIVYARSALDSPDQLYALGRKGEPVQLTDHNAKTLAELKFGAYEQFSFPGWNGETVHGYVVKPTNYVEGKKYPVAFLIHGGPQGSFGNLFHYRWNAETYAGAGYAVVMIDFHGSTGYGQAFTDAISQHWGDRPLEDLQKGWAYALAKYPFLNGDRACALGGSYGGFMIDWIAGNWNKPWKCLVNHDGVFDARMMGYATEELWFENWEQGGMPWEVPANYEKFNPADYVANWTVPELVVHGAKDYRIPVEQGLASFDALQGRHVPSQLLFFPDENHWVLKPQNSLQWHQTVEAWLNRWTAQ